MPQHPPPGHQGKAYPPYLPGFGLPVNYAPLFNDQYGNSRLSLFPNVLIASDILRGGRNALPLTTLREFTMLRLMNQLTDKPEWDKKVFNEAIIEKWKAEALSTESLDITPAMVNWCIAELQYKAKFFQSSGGLVTVYNGDVVKSDTIIPSSLQEALKAAVAPLENVPDREKDWHPGSGEKVLNLVHPSLFPLVYGRSRGLKEGVTSLDDCIERCGEGETIPVSRIIYTEATWSPADEVNEKEECELAEHEEPDDGVFEANWAIGGTKWRKYPYSRKFQWLPCQVDISGEGDSVKITSYINNLHPRHHKHLYYIIEKIIARAIPLWNLTLNTLKAPQTVMQRICYEEVEYDPDPEAADESEGPQQEDGEDDDTFYERRREWISDTRRVVQPEPEGLYKPPFAMSASQCYGMDELTPKYSIDLRRHCRERGLQIIVKLANIHLTPEKPEYKGDTWHVEGQLNEHICSTALYYYDNENITPTTLAFRQQSDPDTTHISYPEDVHDWLDAVFGCSSEDSAIQQVGGIDTREGRLITFPNILQHQVRPFKLVDPTKPGHQKVIALFLVDPLIQTISTAHVPCQQKEWWMEAVGPALAQKQLPAEVQQLVFDAIDEFPISMQEAKKLRRELMAERKVFAEDHSITFTSTGFSLAVSEY
ncbi:hypothetical protein BDQ12DRAFT_693870 [Crucibulum laeve]|uniref:Uncharacterized protein n=1 Tax=Crucibulum laeve TaxID=68775 RepID=A0A5C3LER4_9AGAR|nr:hypothetical protein BDQ12DRAFT_693870 [Crucibulum laeve]